MATRPGEAASLATAGSVAEIRGFFCARVQYRSDQGKKAQPYGPRRLEQSEAEGDLASMRAAAAVFPNDRVKAFQSMHAEARRIQERVKYERDIDMAMLRRLASVESDSENDEKGDLLVEDHDEWWRDLQDGKITTEQIGPKSPLGLRDQFVSFEWQFLGFGLVVHSLERRIDPGRHNGVLNERVGRDDVDLFLALLWRESRNCEPNQLKGGRGVFPAAVSNNPRE